MEEEKETEIDDIPDITELMNCHNILSCLVYFKDLEGRRFIRFYNMNYEEILGAGDVLKGYIMDQLHVVEDEEDEYDESGSKKEIVAGYA